jgi:hypothetical protein
MKSALGLVWLAVCLVACGGGQGSSTENGGSGGAGASITETSAGSGAGGNTGAAGNGGAGGGGAGGGANMDIPGGGTVLFEEKFEDDDFAGRGWYDGSSGALSTAEHVEGNSSFECQFDQGASSCKAGKPARHPVPPTESVYLSFHIQFSDNWVGSGKPYHPHMFHFITDEDDQYVGPAHTFLTTYTEVVQGKALLALQDSKNVDLSCILKNDDSFVGCGGDFASYAFTEARSACSCNGLAGFLDGRDCFPNGDGTWYSARSWHSDGAFTDQAGPSFKGDWHFVEVYFELNTVENGVGVPDGKIRWVQDGKTLIASDEILLRTGAHPNMKFNQFAMLPYIGDGSPVEQSFWIDDLTVATAKP